MRQRLFVAFVLLPRLFVTVPVVFVVVVMGAFAFEALPELLVAVCVVLIILIVTVDAARAALGATTVIMTGIVMATANFFNNSRRDRRFAAEARWMLACSK